jgi:hypothetical protein
VITRFDRQKNKNLVTPLLTSQFLTYPSTTKKATETPVSNTIQSRGHTCNKIKHELNSTHFPVYVAFKIYIIQI